MQQTPASKSLNGIKGSCFDIRLEYNQEYVIVHLPYVDRMTKDVYIEMKYLLEDWTEFFMTMGYKGTFAATDPTTKVNKLALMLGFEYLQDSQGMSIYVYKG